MAISAGMLRVHKFARKREQISMRTLYCGRFVIASMTCGTVGRRERMDRIEAVLFARMTIETCAGYRLSTDARRPRQEDGGKQTKYEC